MRKFIPDMKAKGQSLPIIALVILVLFAMVGLAVDVNNTYAKQREVVRASNSAAQTVMNSWVKNPNATVGKLSDLAAESLRENNVQIVEAGEEAEPGQREFYMFFIGKDGSPVGCREKSTCPPDRPPPSGTEFIQIQLHGRVDTFFARLAGAESLPVAANVGVTSGPCEEGVYPIGVNAAEIKDLEAGLYTNPEYDFTWDQSISGISMNKDREGKVLTEGSHFTFLSWNSSSDMTSMFEGKGNLEGNYQEANAGSPDVSNPGLLDPDDYVLEYSKSVNFGSLKKVFENHVENRTLMTLPIVEEDSDGLRVTALATFLPRDITQKGGNINVDLVFMGEAEACTTIIAALPDMTPIPTPTPTNTPVQGPTETPTPTPTRDIPTPTQEMPTETPVQTETSEPTNTPEPTDEAIVEETNTPTNTPVDEEPTATPEEEEAEEPTATPEEEEAEEPTATPEEEEAEEPTATPEEEEAEEPTATPEEEEAEEPTATPEEEEAEEPTATPEEEEAEEPTATPEEEEAEEPTATPEEEEAEEPTATPEEEEAEEPTATPEEEEAEEPTATPEEEEAEEPTATPEEEEAEETTTPETTDPIEEDPTATPTEKAVSDDEEGKEFDASLEVTVDEYGTCTPSFTVNVMNTGEKPAGAQGVVVAIEVTKGGEKYVTSIFPNEWEAGTIGPDETVSQDILLTVNDAWLTAEDDAEIKINAEVIAETTDPDHTVGKFDNGTIVRTGEACVDPTNTPIPTPTATDVLPTNTPTANATATAAVNETATAEANNTATAEVNETATAEANETATAEANETATAEANETATAEANETATAEANETATAEEANETATAEANETATAEANETATAEANETATAEANNTATAEVNETATAEANETATAEANETATAEANETATAEANETATAEANETATAEEANETATAEANETATAEANQTATAEANETATAEANETATAEANETATAEANNTATAEVNQTATAEANETATAEANETATAEANETAIAIANETAEAELNETATAYANQTATANANQTATANDNQTATANANQTATANDNQTATAEANQTAEAETATAEANATATAEAATPEAEYADENTQVCLPEPQWMEVTINYSVPAGKIAKLSHTWNVVHPDSNDPGGKLSTPDGLVNPDNGLPVTDMYTKWSTGNTTTPNGEENSGYVFTGNGSISMHVYWPGMRSEDEVVETHAEVAMRVKELDENNNPTGESQVVSQPGGGNPSVDYYWQPSDECPAPTPEPPQVDPRTDDEPNDAAYVCQGVEVGMMGAGMHPDYHNLNGQSVSVPAGAVWSRVQLGAWSSDSSMINTSATFTHGMSSTNVAAQQSATKASILLCLHLRDGRPALIPATAQD